jgi:hypothetical protein
VEYICSTVQLSLSPDVGLSPTITTDELADVWQGCGGAEKNSSASVKLSVSWNMTCGDLGLHLESGCTQDKSSPLATEALPVGALRIADLGYFSLKTLRK